MRQINGITLTRPTNPGACRREEEYVVIQKESETCWRLVETWKGPYSAQRAARVLNEHEAKNGRPENYGWDHAPEQSDKP